MFCRGCLCPISLALCRPIALYCLHLPSIPCLDNFSHGSLIVGDVHFDNFGPDHPPNYSTLPPVASLAMRRKNWHMCQFTYLTISYVNHAQNTAHVVKIPLPGRPSSSSSLSSMLSSLLSSLLMLSSSSLAAVIVKRRRRRSHRHCCRVRYHCHCAANATMTAGRPPRPLHA